MLPFKLLLFFIPSIYACWAVCNLVDNQVILDAGDTTIEIESVSENLSIKSDSCDWFINATNPSLYMYNGGLIVALNSTPFSLVKLSVVNSGVYHLGGFYSRVTERFEIHTPGVIMLPPSDDWIVWNMSVAFFCDQVVMGYSWALTAESFELYATFSNLLAVFNVKDVLMLNTTGDLNGDFGVEKANLYTMRVGGNLNHNVARLWNASSMDFMVYGTNVLSLPLLQFYGGDVVIEGITPTIPSINGTGSFNVTTVGDTNVVLNGVVNVGSVYGNLGNGLFIAKNDVTCTGVFELKGGNFSFANGLVADVIKMDLPVGINTDGWIVGSGIVLKSTGGIYLSNEVSQGRIGLNLRTGDTVHWPGSSVSFGAVALNQASGAATLNLPDFFNVSSFKLGVGTLIQNVEGDFVCQGVAGLSVNQVVLGKVKAGTFSVFGNGYFNSSSVNVTDYFGIGGQGVVGVGEIFAGTLEIDGSDLLWTGAVINATNVTVTGGNVFLDVSGLSTWSLTGTLTGNFTVNGPSVSGYTNVTGGMVVVNGDASVGDFTVGTDWLVDGVLNVGNFYGGGLVIANEVKIVGDKDGNLIENIEAGYLMVNATLGMTLGDGIQVDKLGVYVSEWDVSMNGVNVTEEMFLQVGFLVVNGSLISGKVGMEVQCDLIMTGNLTAAEVMATFGGEVKLNGSVSVGKIDLQARSDIYLYGNFYSDGDVVVKSSRKNVTWYGDELFVAGDLQAGFVNFGFADCTFGALVNGTWNGRCERVQALPESFGWSSLVTRELWIASGSYDVIYTGDGVDGVDLHLGKWNVPSTGPAGVGCMELKIAKKMNYTVNMFAGITEADKLIVNGDGFVNWNTTKLIGKVTSPGDPGPFMFYTGGVGAMFVPNWILAEGGGYFSIVNSLGQLSLQGDVPTFVSGLGGNLLIQLTGSVPASVTLMMNGNSWKISTGHFVVVNDSLPVGVTVDGMDVWIVSTMATLGNLTIYGERDDYVMSFVGGIYPKVANLTVWDLQAMEFKVDGVTSWEGDWLVKCAKWVQTVTTLTFKGLEIWSGDVVTMTNGDLTVDRLNVWANGKVWLGMVHVGDLLEVDFTDQPKDLEISFLEGGKMRFGRRNVQVWGLKVDSWGSLQSLSFVCSGTMFSGDVNVEMFDMECVVCSMGSGLWKTKNGSWVDGFGGVSHERWEVEGLFNYSCGAWRSFLSGVEIGGGGMVTGGNLVINGFNLSGDGRLESGGTLNVSGIGLTGGDLELKGVDGWILGGMSVGGGLSVNGSLVMTGDGLEVGGELTLDGGVSLRYGECWFGDVFVGNVNGGCEMVQARAGNGGWSRLVGRELWIGPGIYDELIVGEGIDWRLGIRNDTGPWQVTSGTGVFAGNWTVGVYGSNSDVLTVTDVIYWGNTSLMTDLKSGTPDGEIWFFNGLNYGEFINGPMVNISVYEFEVRYMLAGIAFEKFVRTTTTSSTTSSSSTSSSSTSSSSTSSSSTSSSSTSCSSTSSSSTSSSSTSSSSTSCSSTSSSSTSRSSTSSSTSTIRSSSSTSKSSSSTSSSFTTLTTSSTSSLGMIKTSLTSVVTTSRSTSTLSSVTTTSSSSTTTLTKSFSSIPYSTVTSLNLALAAGLQATDVLKASSIVGPTTKVVKSVTAMPASTVPSVTLTPPTPQVVLSIPFQASTQPIVAVQLYGLSFQVNGGSKQTAITAGVWSSFIKSLYNMGNLVEFASDGMSGTIWIWINNLASGSVTVNPDIRLWTNVGGGVKREVDLGWVMVRGNWTVQVKSGGTTTTTSGRKTTTTSRKTTGKTSTSRKTTTSRTSRMTTTTTSARITNIVQAEYCAKGKHYNNPKNCCCAPPRKVYKWVDKRDGGLIERQVNGTLEDDFVDLAHLCPICPSRSPGKKIWCCGKRKTVTVTKTRL